MKTAISLDDDLLEEADNTARSMGLSRSRLFSLALRDYLKRRKDEAVTERLNRVYATPPNPEERRTVSGMKRKFRSIIQERW